MDSLLCEEEWPSSPITPGYPSFDVETHHDILPRLDGSTPYTTKEDFEQYLSLCLEKEITYMPQKGYLEHLQSNNLLFARFRAIQWLIKTRGRLNLSFATVFFASNYLDRFFSITQCHNWKYWMVELLSVACLSLASKFNETSNPSFYEMQLEDLDHSYEPKTIQRMELIVLEALGWRLGSTTAYSYVELLISNIDHLKSCHRLDLIGRVSDLLLDTMLDGKLLAHRPSIVAVSVLRSSLKDWGQLKPDTHLIPIIGLFNKDQKDELDKCQKIMEARMANPCYKLVASLKHSFHMSPSCPMTVLLTKRMDTTDRRINLSAFHQMFERSKVVLSGKKRKRINGELYS